jgi:rare lipoprotein A (peptidoglycan hydrolase)
MTSIAAVYVFMAIHASPTLAQDFDERWSIIPKAHAEPPPKREDQTVPQTQTEPQTAPEGIRRSDDHAPPSFSGKASFYSYSLGKTASGSKFNRDLPTAAHRSLPFGTRIRVTNLANQRSVVVVINDRGPHVRGRVLDLSLAAARSLGMTDRGVANVRGEVL